MTLLESVIALVILSLSAIGVLELFQESDRAALRAQQWSVAAGYAEEGIETAKLGAPLEAVNQEALAAGYSRRIRSEAAPHGLIDIIVAVGLPDGATLTLHRLAQTR